MLPESHAVKFAAVLCATLALGACSSNDKPEDPDPSGRHKVLLEIDQMIGTPPLTGIDKLKRIYADAGIDLDVRLDQTDLPRVETVRLGDLHASPAPVGPRPPPGRSGQDRSHPPA